MHADNFIIVLNQCVCIQDRNSEWTVNSYSVVVQTLENKLPAHASSLLCTYSPLEANCNRLCDKWLDVDTKNFIYEVDRMIYTTILLAIRITVTSLNITDLD